MTYSANIDLTAKSWTMTRRINRGNLTLILGTGPSASSYLSAWSWGRNSSRSLAMSGRMKPMRPRVRPTLVVDRVLIFKAIGACLLKERNTDKHLSRLDGALAASTALARADSRASLR
jgi:hypothetical protein